MILPHFKDTNLLDQHMVVEWTCMYAIFVLKCDF